MKIVTHVLAAVIAAVLVLLPIAGKLPSLSKHFAVIELVHMRQSVEKEIEDMSQQLVERLTAFGGVVSKDRDFSMKLLVERDFSAPEVTEMASRYMAAMGLSVLDITDGKYTVLSSGHFPARAGMSAARKGEVLGETPTFIVEDIRGESVLTLQAKTAFSCAGVSFVCMGGLVIDSTFLARIVPREGARILLKRGSEVTGMRNVATMSEIKGNMIVINNESYLASAVSLPTAEHDIETTQLILVVEEPAKTSLLTLF